MTRPKLFAILNLTPDSFSGDGRIQDAALRIPQLMEEGADIIDIGAESTRPGATPLTHAEEWARLSACFESCTQPIHTLPISIDTRHAKTAQNVLAMGVRIINDVGGLRDAAMREVLADSDCEIVVMHSLTIPADKAITLPSGCNPVQVILEWKNATIALAESSGIIRERLIFDPGIGFGKTSKQSLDLILRANELVASGGNWLYGHSRKSFLSLFSDVAAHERDALTLAFSTQLASAGVQYLRVHNLHAHTELFNNT